MRSQPSPELPFRMGCLFALVIATGTIIAVEAVREGPVRTDDWPTLVLELLLVGAPFALLALMKIRDWLAWLVAIMLTAGVWGWLIHSITLNEGVNFLLGGLILIAPVVISLASLVVAGMRGKIAWANEEDCP
jgi:peptidoglycan/LPS O-acetylase OafA/YrhL